MQTPYVATAMSAPTMMFARGPHTDDKTYRGEMANRSFSATLSYLMVRTSIVQVGTVYDDRHRQHQHRDQRHLHNRGDFDAADTAVDERIVQDADADGRIRQAEGDRLPRDAIALDVELMA